MRSFSDHNPIAVFAYYACVLVPAMFCMDPVLLAVAFVFGFAFCLIKQCAKTKAYLIYFGIPLFGGLIDPLVNHNGATVLFVMNDRPVTLQAAMYGFCAGLMISAALIWFLSFSKIMTGDKLLYIFGSLSPKLALILSMTLRYIPLFRRQSRKVSRAQQALGLYKEDNWIDKIKKGLAVFSVMTTWALENGVITADSMTARGYGCGKRSHFEIFRWRKQDVILLCASLGLEAFVLISLLRGNASYEWFPHISRPEFDIMYILTVAAYAALAAIPAGMQGKEEMRWRSLRSTV